MLSAPKAASAATEHASPIPPLARFSRFVTCSMNSTTNSAVRAKSMPVVSKVSRLPARPPTMENTTQYSQVRKLMAK